MPHGVYLVTMALHVSVTVSQQADDYTSGFMSLDRIEAAVQESYMSEDHAPWRSSVFSNSQ